MVSNMASWQPNVEAVRQLAACLKDSLNGFNQAAQKQAEILLGRAKASPDYINYLVYLMTSRSPPPGVQCSDSDYHIVRSSAAMSLKNSLKTDYKRIPASAIDLIKMAVPVTLQDPNTQIRNFAGIICTEMVSHGRLMSWPALLPQLLDMAGNASGQIPNEGQEGAMAAMAKICEDNPKVLERTLNGERPLNFILPRLIQATGSPLAKVRTQALTAINVFTSRNTQAMLICIDDLLLRLFSLASDPSPDVRVQVCKAFVQLVDTRADKLQPHLAGLVDYILSQQKGDDEDLACEAAEFWLAVGEHENLWQDLSPHVPNIIPVLLDCMIYSGDDIALLGGASDDEDEEDRAEDMEPQFAKKSAARLIASAALVDPAQNGNSYEKVAPMATEDDALEEGEVDEPADGDDGSIDEKWNLRKCSAAALDVFARDYGGPVFQSILPYLETNLKHDSWPQREAAVLALGAVAEGCMGEVVPHLPVLVPYLLTLLNDPEPVVRQITCWTLGRYSAWAGSLSNDIEVKAYFEPMMEGLLIKMLDKNKKVQQAAASAFAHLQEDVGQKIKPYSGPIIQQFIQCFGRYKEKNRNVLYDCVQTLAESISSELARPELVTQLMPALIGRWHKVSDHGKEMIHLLECLSYVAMALGDAFTPYAQPIFNRCVTLIHQNLQASLAHKHNPALDLPDRDYLVTSLDLLSAIVQSLDTNKTAQLVQCCVPSFFELLTLCMEDVHDDVRQSAYALLGDVSKYLFAELHPHLDAICPVLVRELNLDSIPDEEAESGFSVVNNACWSAGEIAIQCGNGMGKYVPQLFERFLDIIRNPNIPRSVTENAGVALGRLGLCNSAQLAPHLAEFAGDFLDAMDDVDPSEEKATAFRGFVVVVVQNPPAMEKTLLHLFTAIARYRDIKLKTHTKSFLHDDFQKVINTYRQMIPQFNDFLGGMAPFDQQALRANYIL